ncbi:hypothetical protein B4U80_11878, partial [Leptotrombidium deliense]
FNHTCYNLESGERLSAREGTKNDKKRIKSYFKSISFQVRVFKDPTYLEIQDALNAYAKNKVNYDCLVCFFLTHGAMNKLYAYDRSYEIDHILIPFIADNEEKTDGKPKIFVLNACQNTSFGFNPYDARFEEKILKRMCIPESHVLVALSAAPGFVSLRNTRDGAFFIDYFLETLRMTKESNKKKDIHKILEKAYKHMEKDQKDYTGMFVHLLECEFNPTMGQCPAYVSTLTKFLDLHRNLRS